MRYKRFYLASGSILLIFALIAPFVEYYYDYEEIIHCAEECWVEFCMKNGNRNLYFYNRGELPLTFSPEDEVNNVQFFKRDRRYKLGYREIDFITPYSKGRKYVFKIPAYSFTCYGMKVFKEPTADVKWTFAGLDPWLIGTEQGNLSYEVDDCYNNTIGDLGDCFAINWSLAADQINWSDNATSQSGNYTWNFTQLNVSPVDAWLFNFTNNGTTNITVSIKLNNTNTSWQLYYYNGSTRFNLTSTSFIALLNLTTGTTKLVNFTLDIRNVSQTYVNWSLNKSTAEWGFNYTLNVTSY